jgi:hypothetical protein
MRVLALEDQVVRIEWRLADGSIHVQEVRCPPKELRDVREWERRVSLPDLEPGASIDIPILRAKHLK